MRRAIALFAKEPRTGRVKTRLIPQLGAEGAALLARALLEDSSVAVIRAARQCGAAATLFFDPPEAYPTIEAIVPGELPLIAQAAGDLGARLAQAYERFAAQGYTSVCFVGADSPTLPLGYIASAFDALDAGADVALGPAEDGGYYLIALSGAHLGLFERITWSTRHVYAQTCARAASLELRLAALPPWYDVDDAASLGRLRRELAASELLEDDPTALATRRALTFLDSNLDFKGRPTGRDATLT